MNRREPLTELPLDRFLSLDSSVFRSTRNKKRPLSPGTPTLFSPAKRRILNEEGVFSPEKTVKAPFFASSQALGSPARFSNVLVGPSSPARVLDFGSRKTPQPHVQTSDPIKSTPKSSSSLNRSLAPSPEMKMPTSRGAVELLSDNESEHYVSQYRRPSKMAYIMVPRDMPPVLDSSSIHYPGFTVYQDPFIYHYPPVIDDDDSAMEEDFDREMDKENLRPRRLTRKAASTPSVGASKLLVYTPKTKTLLDTPDRQSAFSTPDSRIFSPLPEHFSSQESHRSKRSSRRLLDDGMDSDDN